MEFLSRQDAGRKLAEHLQQEHVQADLVLGLPRGGVVVAAEVARAMNLPLEGLVVRKIGHPHHREFAVGALAEPDVVILDWQAIERTYVWQEELDDIIAEEKERLGEYRAKFERHDHPDLEGKAALIIDDGIATGLTTEAAVQSARKLDACRVLVATPVTSDSAYERLSSVADHVYTLLVDPGFNAVGQYYRNFAQTTDEEVISLLNLPARKEFDQP
jgi:putative phosphoribosyl transferase